MPREPLLTRPFLLAAAAHFLHALSFHLYLHLPGFLRQLGATEIGIGLIFGVTAVTAIALRPVLGRAMDTRGRRVVIVSGGALSAMTCALYATVDGLGPWIVVIRTAHGLSEAMLFASLFAFASDVVPASRRIEGIALFGVSGMLPMGIGGLLGDAILARGSYRELFLVSAACSAVALLLSLPLVEPVRDPEAAPPRGLVAAIVQPDLLPLWFMGTVFATALAAHFTFFKTFVLTTGVGSVGLFFTAYSLAAIALRLLLGSFPDKVGPKRALYPALASLTAGLALVPAATSPLGIAVAGVLCGLGHGFVFPILLGMVVSRARASERGAALSIFTALFDAGTLVGAPLLGAVIRASGYVAMFRGAAALVVVGSIVFALWDRARR
jgi:MFS family permease